MENKKKTDYIFSKLFTTFLHYNTDLIQLFVMLGAPLLSKELCKHMTEFDI